jgi:hypothetical protein
MRRDWDRFVTSTPEALRAFCAAEMRKWGEAARRAGIMPQ